MQVYGRKRPGSLWINRQLINLACSALAFGAVLFWNDICWYILGACVLYFLAITEASLKRANSRMIHIFALFTTVVVRNTGVWRHLVVLTAASRQCIYASFGSITTAVSDDKKDQSPPSAIVAAFLESFERYLVWMSYVMIPAFALLPLPLLVLCYRIDYANHTKDFSRSIAFQTASEAGLRPKSSSSAPFQEAYILDNAAVIPSALPPFKKPYFSSAFAAWLAGNALSLAIALFTSTREAWQAPPSDRLVYAMLTVGTSLLMMLLSTFTVAAFRGEVRKLWQYQDK